VDGVLSLTGDVDDTNDVDDVGELGDGRDVAETEGRERQDPESAQDTPLSNEPTLVVEGDVGAITWSLVEVGDEEAAK